MTFDNRPGCRTPSRWTRRLPPDDDGQLRRRQRLQLQRLWKDRRPCWLTKDGTSTLTLATANDYTGGSTINAGKVIPRYGSIPGSTSGLGNGPITIAAGATVQAGNGTAESGIYHGIDHPQRRFGHHQSARFFHVNAPIDGAGTLTVQGGGTVACKRACKFQRLHWQHDR